MLGCAALALHDVPVLARADIAAAFQTMSAHPPPHTALAGALVSCGLADQIEMIKITPSTLGREEMAWLWTALKADYRPTYPFMVTVVLLQAERPVSVGLPVLHRNLQANAIQPAQILSLRPGSEVGATPGEKIVAAGEFLGGVTQVVLQSDSFGSFGPIAVSQASNNSFAFTLSATPQPPAGVYSLSGQILDTTGAVQQSTNATPIALAPSLPAQAALRTNVTGGVEIGVASINPPISERQTVELSLSTVGPLRLGERLFQRRRSAGGPDRRQRDDGDVPVSLEPADRRLAARPARRRRRRQPGDGRLDAASADLHRPDGDDMNRPVAISWAERNQAYLVAEFARLREKLDGQAPGERPQPMTPPAAIDLLAEIFGLSDFERELLLLCAGVEMELAIAERCAAAGASRGGPTFGLAIATLAEPHWSALAPSAPLRRCRLVEVEPGRGVTGAPLRIDERVLHYLAGVNALDQRLAPMLRKSASAPLMAAEHSALADDLELPQGGERALALHLCGDDASGQEAVAAVLAERAGATLYAMRIDDGPGSAAEVETFVALWAREAALLPAALLLQWEGETPSAPARQLAERVVGPLIIASREPIRLRRRLDRREVSKPGPAEQKRLWRTALGGASAVGDDEIDSVAQNFRLSAETIADLGERQLRRAEPESGALWRACRAVATPKLSHLARAHRGESGLRGYRPAAAAAHIAAPARRPDTPTYESLRGLGFCRERPARPRSQRAVRRPERNRQDAGRRSARRRPAARPLSHRSVERGQQVHRRNREEPARSVRRGRGRRRAAAVRRGRRAVRQALAR